MELTSLNLVNYKNFEAMSFEFDRKINCFIGKNGVGKTNVLDAIYHLAFGKSYFNPVTSQNIRHGADFFMVEGHFKKGEKTRKRQTKEEHVIVSAGKKQKKTIKRNGKAYEKLADHIGRLPLVIISPTDRDLITEGSETRRKFLNGIISQSDKQYLYDLIAYNKVLSQRNALIRYIAANHTSDPDTLEIYNRQLSELGTGIFEKRNAFIQKFIPIFRDRHRAVSKGRDEVSLQYSSKVKDKPLSELLEESLQRDLIMQYTTVGAHKDDLKFLLRGYPIKKYGSQGQQKTYLIALKLAQFDFLAAKKDDKPILLLDDIFDKLDEERVSQLISLVNEDRFGQLFISDTHAGRTETAVKGVNQGYQVFEL